MTATKIDGTAIAKSIRDGLKNEILRIQQSNPRFKPGLVIIQGTCIRPYWQSGYSNWQYSWRTFGLECVLSLVPLTVALARG